MNVSPQFHRLCQQSGSRRNGRRTNIRTQRMLSFVKLRAYSSQPRCVSQLMLRNSEERGNLAAERRQHTRTRRREML